jgi:hypothetical protein
MGTGVAKLSEGSGAAAEQGMLEAEIRIWTHSDRRTTVCFLCRDMHLTVVRPSGVASFAEADDEVHQSV